VQDVQTTNKECFCYLNHEFVTAVKLLGNSF